MIKRKKRLYEVTVLKPGTDVAENFSVFASGKNAAGQQAMRLAGFAISSAATAATIISISEIGSTVEKPANLPKSLSSGVYPPLGWNIFLYEKDGSVLKRILVAVEDPGAAIAAAQNAFPFARKLALEGPVAARELKKKRLREGEVCEYSDHENGRKPKL